MYTLCFASNMPSSKGDLHDNSYNVNATFHGKRNCKNTMSAQDGDIIPKQTSCHCKCPCKRSIWRRFKSEYTVLWQKIRDWREVLYRKKKRRKDHKAGNVGYRS